MGRDFPAIIGVHHQNMRHPPVNKRLRGNDGMAGAGNETALFGRVQVDDAIDHCSLRIDQIGKGGALCSRAPQRNPARLSKNCQAGDPFAAQGFHAGTIGQRKGRGFLWFAPDVDSARPCLEPQILASEHMADESDFKSGTAEQARQRSGGEQRAMFVEKIPQHLTPKDPVDAGGFEPYLGVRGRHQCRADRL